MSGLFDRLREDMRTIILRAEAMKEELDEPPVDLHPELFGQLTFTQAARLLGQHFDQVNLSMHISRFGPREKWGVKFYCSVGGEHFSEGNLVELVRRVLMHGRETPIENVDEILGVKPKSVEVEQPF